MLTMVDPNTGWYGNAHHDTVMNTNYKDGAPALDQGSQLDRRQRFVGIWGADRNSNHVLDRGPVPKSVRLRAVPVARFNFYDPRVPFMIR